MAKYSTLDALATGEGVAMLGSVARLPKATASVYCGANGLERGRGRGALSPGADSARCRCAEAQMGAGAGGCFCLIVSGRKADSAAVALRRNMISSTEEAACCGGGMADNGLCFTTSCEVQVLLARLLLPVFGVSLTSPSSTSHMAILS